MISRFTTTFHTDLAFVQWNAAYALYCELLKQLREDSVQALHQNGFKPISHYVHMPQEHTLKWVVSVFDDILAQDVASFFAALDILSIWGEASLQKTQVEKVEIVPSDLVERSLLLRSNAVKIHFLTPTTFRTEGEYATFPTPRLILSHLANKWSKYVTDYQLKDEDALQMLCDGVAITGYRLKSANYRMKNKSLSSGIIAPVLIPGFTGEITLTARLPKPIGNIFHMLLAFAQYSGIGIKTTLGMGGTTLVLE